MLFVKALTQDNIYFFIKLTRATMGYSRTLSVDGRGGGVSPPPLLAVKPLDELSIQKRYLIAPGLNFPNMLQNFI